MSQDDLSAARGILTGLGVSVVFWLFCILVFLL